MRRIALFLSVGAAVMLLASGAMAKQPKVDVCHVPPGNPANAHTINISENAVPDHIAHGDTLGECECQVDEDCANDTLCDEDSCVAGKCQHFQVGCPAIVCFQDRVCDPTTGLCPEPEPVECDTVDEECNPETGECIGVGPCDPGGCATGFIQCNDNASCICGEAAEGGGFCFLTRSCGEVAPCPNGTGDCPPGETCVINTCCNPAATCGLPCPE